MPLGLDWLPSEVRTYLASLVDTARKTLRTYEIGVYLFGSAAARGFEPGSSDLDVQIVILSEHDTDLRVSLQLLAAAVSHAVLPCPAAKLELVVYVQSNVSTRSWSMNYNTGPTLAQDVLSFDSSAVPRFWFVLDVAAGWQNGIALHGPPVHDVIHEPDYGEVSAALRDSLSWHLQHLGSQACTSPNAVLNAARALVWIDTGEWLSKAEGARRVKCDVVRKRVERNERARAYRAPRTKSERSSSRRWAAWLVSSSSSGRES